MSGWLRSGELIHSSIAEAVTDAHDRISLSPYLLQIDHSLILTAHSAMAGDRQQYLIVDPRNIGQGRRLCVLGRFARNGFVDTIETFIPAPEGPPFKKVYQYDPATDIAACTVLAARPADMLEMVDRFFAEAIELPETA